MKSLTAAFVVLISTSAFAQTTAPPQSGVDPRPPNAPNQKPAFPGQTRAPERKRTSLSTS